jgi:pimeloyl-ACP methyl ester carboxylesterase
LLAGEFVTTRYGKLHYRATGSGPPLLLLHATPRSSRAFEQLIPLLANDYRIIALDTLGFGESDPLPTPVSIEILAASVASLMEKLDLTPAAVFGLHTGNKIAAALAAGWPQHVAHLIVCGMTHSIIVDQAQRDEAIRRILKANPIDPNLVTHPLEKLDRLQGEKSVPAIYPANYAFDFVGTLAAVPMPTLVLELAAAAEAHLPQQGAVLARLIPNGKARVLERSDREVLEKNPSELADAILGFLAAN